MATELDLRPGIVAEAIDDETIRDLFLQMPANKQQAIELLAAGHGPKAVANEVGVTPQTLWTWRQRDDFDLVYKWRARSATVAIALYYQPKIAKALEVLETIMTNTITDPKTRVTAADKLITNVLRITAASDQYLEIMKLRQRLADLEAGATNQGELDASDPGVLDPL